jgi:DNA-binding transcriptional regulator YiaG
MPENTAKITREALSLTQVQFAQILGVHPLTVSKWEREVSELPAYYDALFQQFQVAAKNKEVRENLERVLIGMGVIFALALLLKHLTK